ncbi:MAG: CBS domain-containing protein, partial [Spirochaetales bacterium]|nr:CBS domain-containing protein [Spirochaetales bacterium]
IVQIIGPTMVKVAIKLAKETGKNITEEDVIAKWQVADVLDAEVPMVKISDSVKEIVTLFSESNYFCLPVVDQQNKTVGMITINDLKELLISQDTWEWILAGDILSTTSDVITKTTSLEEAMTTLRQLGREQLPVIESIENPVPVGILDTRVVRKLVDKEMVGIK